MTIPDPTYAGYSEAAATVFTWLADKVLGGAKKALGWGWERAQWVAAQDRYDEQIIKQYGWIRIFGQTTPKPLKEVFTDVYMLDKPTAFSRFDPDALREHLWNEDRSVPFRQRERLPADQLLARGSKFFILGKPGAGKTTFLKHLAVREAQRGKWGRCIDKIPIFVPLKQFAESGKTLLDFIVDQFAVCHFPDAAPFVEPLLKSGKALVLFDGLDEVTKAADAREDQRSHVTAMIEQFSRQYDRCHIAITCRIAATEYMLDPAFSYLELVDFAPDQVVAFVRNWFWDPAETDRSAGMAGRMLAEWAKPENEGIRDLTRNPLLLTLLCLNYAETLSFPARRVEIYQEAMDALLKKWDTSRQIQRGSLYKTLSIGRKQQMFSRIAYEGFVQGDILFAQSTLEARLKTYLTHVPEIPDAVDIDAEAVLREIIEQHGIFAEQAHGFFSFAHLTFQEYYVAKYLMESPAPDALDPLMAHVTDDKWREVFLLIASLLPDATTFLIGFETALRHLIAPRPRLVAWLRWIDAHAGVSQADLRRSATRLWYARELARELVRDLALARDLLDNRELVVVRYRSGSSYRADGSVSDISLAHALDLALTTTGTLPADVDLARARAFDRARDHNRKRDLGAILRRIQEFCLELGDASLNEALSALVIPPMDAPLAAWKQLASQLDHIIRTEAMLGRYRQVKAETRALVAQKKERWQLDLDDQKDFVTYVTATQLFYDCLQLAYTPDRRAFEDRILLPPPLPEQKA